MSPAIVIVPVMLLIVLAAVLLAAVLAYPYQGKRLPENLPAAEPLDRFLESLAQRAGIGRHPNARDREDVSSGLPTLSSSRAPRD